MGLISVVVVTCNSKKYIEPCLNSVLAQQNAGFEIMVIDNASGDGTREILKNRFGRARLIENPANYGYPQALNQGIANTTGEFILCLNDDVELKNNDFLTRVCESMEKDRRVGAVQPKILKPDGLIDTCGIALSFLRRFHDLNNGKMDTPDLNREKYVFGACNAAVLYRRKALEGIKQGNDYFDADFFGLVEDVDISWRLGKRSWRTLYQPLALAVHHRGLSRRRDNFTQYLNLRNRYLMIIKNETFWGFLRLPLIFLFYDCWRNLFMFMVNRKYSLKAYAEVLGLLKKMWHKRKAYNPHND